MVTDLTIVSQAAAPLDADLTSGTAPSAAVTALRSAEMATAIAGLNRYGTR